LIKNTLFTRILAVYKEQLHSICFYFLASIQKAKFTETSKLAMTPSKIDGYLWKKSYNGYFVENIALI